MVKPFQFSRLPKIYFRNGGIGDLVSLTRNYGKRWIIVSGRESFVKTPYASELFNNLLKENITFYHIRISGEPSPENIDQAVKDFKDEKIDLVTGIGGGSVLDAAKAISAMMYKENSVIEFLESVGNKEHPGTKLPYIAIPTTSGTGSEATKNAVISKTGLNGFKRSLRHDNLVPDIALIDPQLTISCPPELTAACGMDCFTQLTEAYLSEKSGLMTDALAIEGIKSIKTSLRKSYSEGENKEARAGMSFAALASGICLANAGLGSVHGFASSIGGMFDIPHGIVCARLMAKTNEINIRELRKTGANPEALRKYALLGRIFADNHSATDDYFIDGFVNFLYELTDMLQLPVLGTFGLTEKDIEPVCSHTENKNNPVNLDLSNLSEILLGCI